MPHGQFAWNELMTREPEKAMAFFGETIGWTFTKHTFAGDYWVAEEDGRPLAGVMPIAGVPGMEAMPDAWMAYIEVDDVDARVAKVAAAGGTVLRPPFDIAGVGRIAMVADPSGVPVGWMTPEARPGNA